MTKTKDKPTYQETSNVEGKVKNIYLRFGNVKLKISLLKIRGVSKNPHLAVM